MKTASILVISLLAIIGGAAPAPALDDDNLQLYKRQAPPESPIAPPRKRKQERLLKQEQEREQEQERNRPSLLPKPDQPKPGRPIPHPRSFSSTKLGNPNSNDETKEVKVTVPNSPEGEGSSLEESDDEEDSGSEFNFDPDFDFDSQPMTPEEITTPEFNQQSNVQSPPKQALLPPPLLLPSRMRLPLPEVLPPPEDDEASEFNDEAPKLNDEDSNANDETKDVKDESSNKPAEEVGSSKASKFFTSLLKMASGFELSSNLGKSKPKNKGAVKGNDNSGPGSDPDDSEPQPTTPEDVKPSQSNSFLDELKGKASAMQARGGGLSGAPQVSESNVHSKPGNGKPQIQVIG
ncbi:hypothetical protein BASA83_008946 [Batrachochytrium salamandrivorans]|nr:hypothetical protein BASA83_008946 [Batrachochytrium salamandrivorans]